MPEGQVSDFSKLISQLQKISNRSYSPRQKIVLFMCVLFAGSLVGSFLFRGNTTSHSEEILPVSNNCDVYIERRVYRR